MEVETRKEHFADTGEEIESFIIKTKRGYAHGFFHNDTISIHHIGTNPGQAHPVKGIMNTLCRRYRTAKFKFLMVVNPELKNTIKGTVVKIPPDAPDNPFGEWLEEIHGTWEVG